MPTDFRNCAVVAYCRDMKLTVTNRPTFGRGWWDPEKRIFVDELVRSDDDVVLERYENGKRVA